ncbi:MAG TPA: hypothetical protein VJR89_37000, partial [Polyangiales bacterium]|nr:hypothetical protein [Polyangiales bacterium]
MRPIRLTRCALLVTSTLAACSGSQSPPAAAGHSAGSEVPRQPVAASTQPTTPEEPDLAAH